MISVHIRFEKEWKNRNLGKKEMQKEKQKEKQKERQERKEEKAQDAKEWQEGLRSMTDEEQAEYLRQWLENKERERERLNNTIRCLRKELMTVTIRIQKKEKEWKQKESELGVDEFGNLRLEDPKPSEQECF